MLCSARSNLYARAMGYFASDTLYNDSLSRKSRASNPCIQEPNAPTLSVMRIKVIADLRCQVASYFLSDRCAGRKIKLRVDKCAMSLDGREEATKR